MHVITLTPTGYRVDLDTAVTKTVATWSSDTRERSGMPADRVMVQLFATAHESNGREWPCLVGVWEDEAVSNGRRERVIKELHERAAECLAALKTLPGEDLVVAPPPVAKPVKAPAKPGALPTPTSNNDEIARALVRRATYDAAELGNTVVATNVQCVFEAYVADNKLSERRAAGVKAKCAALGYVW